MFEIYSINRHEVLSGVLRVQETMASKIHKGKHTSGILACGGREGGMRKDGREGGKTGREGGGQGVREGGREEDRDTCNTATATEE